MRCACSACPGWSAPIPSRRRSPQNGRYGPYRKGSDSRSLDDEEQIFSVTVEEALRIYAEPKRGRGQRVTAPLKELGEDLVSNKPVVVKDGRFGPYVTDGEVNVAAPRRQRRDHHDRAGGRAAAGPPRPRPGQEEEVGRQEGDEEEGGQEEGSAKKAATKKP